MSNPSPSPQTLPHNGAIGAVAGWLSVLIVLLIALVALGGFVRLSGSGLSIPDWPLINGSFLPPMSEAGWKAAETDFYADQERLQARLDSGAIGLGSLGKMPADSNEFRTMFYIEWSHRALGGLIAFIAIGCLIIAIRKREVWDRVGPMLASVVLLIVFQATLGGILVKTGTSTHFLFLHLFTAALVLSLILWSLLRLLDRRDLDSMPVRSQRRGLPRVISFGLVLTFIQLILGALVAGSRAGGAVIPEWPLMNGSVVPSLWVSSQPVMWNLLDNAILHQWVHRWFAWGVALMLIVVFWRTYVSNTGPRQRMATHFLLGLVMTQMVLGVMNVFAGGTDILIALAHLVTGFLMVGTQIICLHDNRYEAIPASEQQPNAKAVTA